MGTGTTGSFGMTRAIVEGGSLCKENNYGKNEQQGQNKQWDQNKQQNNQNQNNQNNKYKNQFWRNFGRQDNINLILIVFNKV